MNKKELIERIANLDRVYGEKYYVALEDVLDLVKQLDEPEKVVIPQFVADWIKLSKSIGRSLFGAMRVFEKDDDVKKWLQWSENQELFARAWLDGYEVEEEKRFLVRFKGLNRRYIILKYDKYDKTWFLGGELEFDFYKKYHTRQELEEDGFGWVFDCEGIEIEEIIE